MSAAPKAGHNSGIAVDQMRSLLERAARLEEEKAALAEDLKELWLEAKSAGFDVKHLKGVLRLQRMEQGDREEFRTTRDLYEDSVFN